MGSLRIHGLVRLAQRVRRELEQPLNPVRQAHLCDVIASSLAHVRQIVATHGTRVEHLPAPSRRAYQLLASLKFDGPVAAVGAPTAPPRGAVKLAGLKSYWEPLLDRLAEVFHVRARVERDGCDGSLSCRFYARSAADGRPHAATRDGGHRAAG